MTIKDVKLEGNTGKTAGSSIITMGSSLFHSSFTTLSLSGMTVKDNTFADSYLFNLDYKSIILESSTFTSNTATGLVYLKAANLYTATLRYLTITTFTGSNPIYLE